MKVEKNAPTSGLEILAHKIIQVDNFCNASHGYNSRSNKAKSDITQVVTIPDGNESVQIEAPGGNESVQIEASAGRDKSLHVKAGESKEYLQSTMSGHVPEDAPNGTPNDSVIDYSDWSSNDRFKKNVSDEGSVELDASNWFWNYGNESLLEELFNEETQQSDTLGLEDLFDEKNIDQ